MLPTARREAPHQTGTPERDTDAAATGGDAWKACRSRLEELERSQLPTGDLRGSWHPAHDCSRVVTTALRTLSLQVPRRCARLIR